MSAMVDSHYIATYKTIGVYMIKISKPKLIALIAKTHQQHADAAPSAFD